MKKLSLIMAVLMLAVGGRRLRRQFEFRSRFQHPRVE